jgi:type I restriction enzyme S subunit
MRRLGDMLKLRKEIIHPRDNPTGYATFVGLEHVESGTGIRTGSATLDMSRLTGRKPKFYEGDIVYGYLRPYLNKVWIAEFEGLCSVDQYVYAVNRDEAEAEFISWFMRSLTYLERAPINTAPAWLPRIRTEEVASVTINLPPAEEQRLVVALMSERMRVMEQVWRATETQLEALEALPGALLEEVFGGFEPPSRR